MVLVNVTGLAPRFANLCSRFLQDFLVRRVFPFHQFFHYGKESLAARCPTCFDIVWWNLARMLEIPFPGWVVHELAEDDGPRRRYWALSPPFVQRGRVAGWRFPF